MSPSKLYIITAALSCQGGSQNWQNCPRTNAQLTKDFPPKKLNIDHQIKYSCYSENHEILVMSQADYFQNFLFLRISWKSIYWRTRLTLWGKSKWLLLLTGPDDDGGGLVVDGHGAVVGRHRQPPRHLVEAALHVRPVGSVAPWTVVGVHDFYLGLLHVTWLGKGILRRCKAGWYYSISTHWYLRKTKRNVTSQPHNWYINRQTSFCAGAKKARTTFVCFPKAVPSERGGTGQDVLLRSGFFFIRWKWFFDRSRCFFDGSSFF